MECRICIDSSRTESMLTPCDCSGSMKYVHKECLLQWVNTRHRGDRCDICLSPYNCRFVATGPNLWQVMRFVANNANLFLLLFLVSLQFAIGVFSALYGLTINAKRVSHCLRCRSVLQMVWLCITSLCLTVTLVANVFWYCMFCVLMAEVVVDSWRENIVYTIED